MERYAGIAGKSQSRGFLAASERALVGVDQGHLEVCLHKWMQLWAAADCTPSPSWLLQLYENGRAPCTALIVNTKFQGY